MAGSLLEYQGNAGLGLGTNPDVSVGPSDQVLSQIHETSRDIMLMDNQRNIMKYQQKIKDRDQLEEMITKGLVSAGDIDQKYRPMYEKARSKVVEQFLAMHGDLNNEEGYLKLDSAIKEANDIANHAQAKTLGMQKLHQEMAAQTTKAKQDEYQKWITQQEARPFWDQVDPYQQLHDFDMGNVTAAKGLTRTITDPNQPLQSFEETSFNYADIFADKWNHWLQQDASSEDYTTFRDKYQAVDPQKLSMSIDNINARLKSYNEIFGYQPGMRGYAAPVNAAVMGDRVMIKDNPVEFAAKYALATQPNWRSVTPGKFNTGAGNFILGQGRLKAMNEKNEIEWFKAHTARMNWELRNKQAAQLNQQQQAITQVWDNILPNIAVPPQIPLPGGQEQSFRIDANTLPPGFANVGGLDSKGNPIALKPMGGQWVPRMGTDGKPMLDAHKQPIRDYVGGYYEPIFYIPKGTRLPNGTIAGKDAEFTKNKLVEQFNKAGGRGDLQDYIMDLFNKKLIDYKLKGENGTATRGSAYVSQIATANKLMKKGQPNPYGAAGQEGNLFNQDDTDDNSVPDNDYDPNQ